MKRPDELTAEQEERLARWRAGEMSEAERATFEREMLASDALSEAAYREAGFDALVTPATAPVRHPARARTPLAWPKLAWRVALPLAATVLAVWLLPPLMGPRGVRAPAAGDDRLRGADGGPALLAPVGSSDAAPARFVWTRDAGATNYRIEVFGPDGARVATGVTSDTTLDVGALDAPMPASGEWRVVPVAADGSERVPSERAGWAAGAR